MPLNIRDVNGQYVSGSPKILLKNNDVVSNEIINVLTTNARNTARTGERIFEPTFGGGLIYYLFEPIDNLTASSIQSVCFSALSNWIPHIQIYLNDIEVQPNPDKGYYKITIYWRDLATDTKGVTNFIAYHARKLVPVQGNS